MAPRPVRRGDAASPQAVYELGVRGRKTGAVLRDVGARDEHGMQPLDDIFSSPRTRPSIATPAEEESGSEDMEIASSAGPGPQTLLKNRNLQFPIPRSRSPLKTSLKSPARRMPLLAERLSSPARGSNSTDRDTTVTRKIDFPSRPDRSKSTLQERSRSPNGMTFPRIDSDNIDPALNGDFEIEDMVNESLHMVDAMRTDPVEPDSGRWYQQERERERRRRREEEEAARSSAMSAKAKGKQRDAEQLPETQPSHSFLEGLGDDAEEPFDAPPSPEPKSSAHKRPRIHSEEPSQSKKQASNQRPLGKATTRATVLDDVAEESEGDDDGRTSKRHRTESARPAANPPPVKRGRGRPPNAEGKRPRGRPKKKPKEDDDDVGETSFMELQRGPPMPKSRGLVSVRRDANGSQQPRSGGNPYKPVDYWRGEKGVPSEELRDDTFYDNGDFLAPTIKEVVRVPDEAPSSKRAPGSKTRTNAKARYRNAVEEDEELEDWEISPGTVTGEIVLWEPEFEEVPPADDDPVQVTDERIAISADAIQTSEVPLATFRFAKTLSMPFMGAGVVDLPPGSEKRPKDSRKMHMVFFVHYGKVMVTINEAQFRISAGGMWFVPRGNYYSITNDYETPCRVFFAQANETKPPGPESEDAGQP